MISDEALQVAARAVHETLNGKGSWKGASADERSASRHLVRVVLKAVETAPAASQASVLSTPSASSQLSSSPLSSSMSAASPDGPRLRSAPPRSR